MSAARPAAPCPLGGFAPDKVDADGELLAELDAKLVEGVDAPNASLNEHAVLRRGRAALRACAGPVRGYMSSELGRLPSYTRCGPMRAMSSADAPALRISASTSSRVCPNAKAWELGEAILQREILAFGFPPHEPLSGAMKVERLGEGALMQTSGRTRSAAPIRARLSPHDAGAPAKSTRSPVKRQPSCHCSPSRVAADRPADARGGSIIRQHREHVGSFKEGAIPHAEQPHGHRQVALERCIQEVRRSISGLRRRGTPGTCRFRWWSSAISPIADHTE